MSGDNTFRMLCNLLDLKQKSPSPKSPNIPILHLGSYTEESTVEISNENQQASRSEDVDPHLDSALELLKYCLPSKTFFSRTLLTAANKLWDDLKATNPQFFNIETPTALSPARKRKFFRSQHPDSDSDSSSDTGGCRPPPQKTKKHRRLKCKNR